MDTLYTKAVSWLVGLAMIFGLLYLVYDKIYDKGYKEAETKYIKQVEELNKSIEIKKAETEVLANFLDSNRASELKEVKLTLDEYIKEFRRLNKPTTTITKEGKCIPSQEFVEAWNEILRRGKNAN